MLSGRSCGPSPYICGIYLFFSGPQFGKTGLENLEQSHKLRITCIWLRVLITASNYQLYTFRNIACNFLSIGCDFMRWRIDGDRKSILQDNLVRGILYFVTPPLHVQGHCPYLIPIGPCPLLRWCCVSHVPNYYNTEQTTHQMPTGDKSPLSYMYNYTIGRCFV